MVTHPLSAVKQPRAKLRIYRPTNRPQTIACLTFKDPILGVVARSERSQSGMLKTPPAIAWDAGVIDQLSKHNVSWLEVLIVDLSQLYTCPLQRFLTHAWLRNGQLILRLEHWDDCSRSTTVHVDSEQKPGLQQMNLFEAPNGN